MATARHPKATFFVQRHLFSGLTSFAELEQKIAALPDEQSRGAAFEVFAEAYLATQRKYDAAQVWPHGSVPLDILKNLGLTQQDQGVDGVLQTLLGQFNAYQIKFRTGRPALTWRELSTFIGLADSPHIHSRVLLTNCDELPAVLNDRQGFFCIRGSDLDRLEADDFRAIEAWLADAAFIAPKKLPQPHQTEALAALLPALQTHDRVSAIMACGTGKTLVALWVAEYVAQASSPAGFGGVPPPVGEHAPGRCVNPPPGTAAPRILVLLPSLALLRQTLHEWLRETHLPSLAYLCVCSDPTVKEGIDALTTQQSDLDFQVSTDPASVRSFLDAPFAGVKMIFSTYQSASVVGAAMKPGETFDFAVFDEAHKTAGREGRNFAFALDDKNLSIRKRLFLTATPRHYNPQKRDQEGEAQLVFSMDNPAIYGPQAYRLTFAEAARRGIICRYKVLISVITSEEVTNELLQRSEVLIDGDPVQARMVANQIALCHAVDKFGAKRIFTFHRTVRDAREFVEGKSGVRNQLKDFNAYHVNGKMTAAQRERLMREFRNCTNGLMSNARCLTEGVDVPAVDMVAFLSPRRSLVDIVQATGRAMRRSPGKSTGFVLVPLYLELATGESIETAVS
jgi:predicted helicase